MMEADFPLLYSKLGVQPGCSLGEFKQAYRRRVAELHPDRVRVPRKGESPHDLTQLIQLYKHALRFHEIHGRLPGSPVGPDEGPPNSAPPHLAASQPPVHRPRSRLPQPPAKEPPPPVSTAGGCSSA